MHEFFKAEGSEVLLQERRKDKKIFQKNRKLRKIRDTYTNDNNSQLASLGLGVLWSASLVDKGLGDCEHKFYSHIFDRMCDENCWPWPF